MAGGGVAAGVGGRLRVPCWIAEGFDRLRTNGGGKRARGVGGGGCDGGGGGVPRPAHLWIPAFAGTTMAGVRGRRGLMVARGGGPAAGGSGRFANGGAPYGGDDAMGGAHEGGVPACEGATRAGGPSTGSGRTDSRSAPAAGCGRVGSAMGVGGGVPRPAHLWIPAFAGTTVEGVRAGEGCW